MCDGGGLFAALPPGYEVQLHRTGLDAGLGQRLALIRQELGAVDELHVPHILAGHASGDEALELAHSGGEAVGRQSLQGLALQGQDADVGDGACSREGVEAPDKWVTR